MDSFTQLGPLARNVDDLVLTLPLLVGPDWRDPAIVPMPLGDPASVNLKQLRVAFHTDNGVITPTPEIMDTVLRAGRVLSDEGIEIEERRPEVIEETTDIIAGLWYAEDDITMRKLLDRAGTTEAWLSLEEWGPPVSFTELSNLLDRWDRYRVEMTRFIESYDVILSPACALPAPLQGDSVEASWEPNASYAQSYNLTGWPAAVVWCGTSPEDLPIGVQVIARPWREEVALAVAKKLEIELGGFQPPPV
jgi:amidase